MEKIMEKNKKIDINIVLYQFLNCVMSGILYNTKPNLSTDFYHHVNWDWLQSNPIPSEYTKWSNFHVLHEQNQNRLREMMETAPESDEQSKLNILWSQGLDSEKLNEQGHLHVKQLFSKFKLDDSIDTFVTELMRYNLCFLFDISAYTDFKNSERNVLYFDVMGLGMPDRDYYLLDTMKEKQDQYKEFLAKFIAHFELEAIPQDIYNFEETVAKTRLSKTDRRDPTKIYNEYNWDMLVAEFPGIGWSNVFNAFGIPNGDKIIITEPKFFKLMSDYLLSIKEGSTPLSQLVNFIKYKIVKSVCTNLDDSTYQIYFDFYGTQLYGQKEPKQRWKRVMGIMESILGEVLSKAYVEKYFKQEQKTSCLEMIGEIVKTFQARLEQLDWMSAETKVRALEKLSKFSVKIGYPDKWTDFSKLVISSDIMFYENILSAGKWEIEHNLEKLYKPVDKLEWHMNAHDINAYYSSTMNEIVFPAGILQAPFYSSEQTLAENLGGIGAVIGHEITHGFDDKGRLYDANGNLNDWWTESDATNFNTRSEKLENVFNSFVFYGMNVNGKLTLGENIADLGGITFSLKTLERLVPASELEKQISLLFVQWAKIWRCNITEDTLKNQLLTDPHSPTQVRVNGILQNLDEFYQVFNIGPNDPMYLNPINRSQIW